jgi:DNA-3-methyladenine glycosylase
VTQFVSQTGRGLLSPRLGKAGPILPAAFYDRPTEQVAREMLGAVLECRSEKGISSGIIVETEAYIGEHDEACHAFAGHTKRTAPLYGRPGISYVYFIYGMYWCFNAVTRAEGLPSAVLVRAVEPYTGVTSMRRRRPKAKRDTDLTNGPGKLCLALGIGSEMNGLPLQRGPIAIRKGIRLSDTEVAVTARIGITKAVDWPLRWIVKDSPYLSRKAPA